MGSTLLPISFCHLKEEEENNSHTERLFFHLYYAFKLLANELIVITQEKLWKFRTRRQWRRRLRVWMCLDHTRNGTAMLWGGEHLKLCIKNRSLQLRRKKKRIWNNYIFKISPSSQVFFFLWTPFFHIHIYKSILIPFICRKSHVACLYCAV